MNAITCAELTLWQTHAFEFDLIDVRRAAARDASGVAIAGARWHDPAQWLDWKDTIETTRPIVVCCAKGHEISQGLTAALRVLGVDARFLVGGVARWCDEGRPVVALHTGTSPG